MFRGVGGADGARLVSKIERIPSNSVNETFISDKAISEGWKPPYPDNLDIRKITTGREMKLYRVHTDAQRPAGRFLAREKELAPLLHDPEALRLHLGLPDVPIYITEVHVPMGTELFVGRIGPQPTFGLMGKSGFQYQTVGKLPLFSFTSTRPIIVSNVDFSMKP